MDKSTKLVRMQQWSEEIAACNQSGMKKGEWCRENGINLKTFYYHQRMVRQAAFNALSVPDEGSAEVCFVEVTPLRDSKPHIPPDKECAASAVIQLGLVRILLNEDISEALLQRLLKVTQDVT